MVSDLYNGAILKAAADIPPASRLENPQASAVKVSRICGSEVSVDLDLDDKRVVSRFAMEAKACALGQASASIVARNIIGASAEGLYALRDQMRAMLKSDGSPPEDARGADLAALQAIREYPQRHASTLLIFEAVVACLDKLAAPSNGALIGEDAPIT